MINTTKVKKKDKQPGNNQLNLTMSTSHNTVTSGNWTDVKKRNHSNSSNSEPPTSPQGHINKNKKKLFSSPNRFDVLRPNETTNENITTDEPQPTNSASDHPTIKPPPPIFIKGVEDFPGLCTALIDLIGVDNFFCKSTTEHLKIQTSNPDSYRTIVHFLREEKAEFHTFQLNEEKPTRVVLRNLHPSTPTALIKSELEVRLFEVRQVTQVIHRLNKQPLPLFFIDLEPTDFSQCIYKLESLLHTKIKIEEPHKPKIISQCHNCQAYGHTKSYCGHMPRCVRCGNNHHSSDCPNSRQDPMRCALCSGNHPANYKGCSTYKDLQSRKKPISNNHNISNLKFKSNNVKESHPSVINNTPPDNFNNPTYSQTYAQATRNQPPPQNIPDNNTEMSSFLNELKLIINPLIELLTKVIYSLLDKKNE